MRHFFLLILLSSCGYRWHYDYPEGHRPTVSVPLIKGDADASLTSEIISSLDSSGVVKVARKGADYRLEVRLLSRETDQIGYRRDPQKIQGEVVTNLLASEARNTLHAKVTLYHRNTDQIAFGPYFLNADTEYDYVDGDSLQDLTFISSSGALEEVLPFSLGQLESVESAYEASAKPIYRKLSQKIVDVISSEW